VTYETNIGVVGGERVLAEAMEAYRAALGDRLLAAYALGSLAHGGFSELVSDIDLGLIVSDPLLPADGSMIQVVADAEKGKGSALHQRLSVFWGTPTTLRGEREGGDGEAGPGRPRRDEAAGERLPPQGDELRADGARGGEARSGAGRVEAKAEALLADAEATDEAEDARYGDSADRNPVTAAGGQTLAGWRNLRLGVVSESLGPVRPS